MYRLLLILFFLTTISTAFKAQLKDQVIDKEKEKMYSPYMYWHHGGKEGLEDFKKNHPKEYQQELWYFCESWYIRKNYLKEGVALDAYVVDIERFEQNRKEHEEAILVLPGCRDAIVFLPADKLIYKPSQK